MKKLKSFASGILLFIPLCMLLFSSCQDDCTETFVWNNYEPVWVSEDSIHVPIRVESPREIIQPGKIYWYSPYLLINEKEKGLHVIDNKNPENPEFISFIAIDGNRDMAILNNMLFADSYFDLIAIDITDINNIQEAGRYEMYRQPYYYDDALSSFVSEYRIVEYTEEVPCDQISIWGGPRAQVDFALESSAADAAAANGGTGTGGSLARFTIAQDHLYIVDEYGMMIFDLQVLSSPDFSNRVDLGWGIETIFPYQDKLFIGANNGMHILDASNPTQPEYLSTFQHANACDPVFVKDEIAYVTLRNGTECETFANQLDIVNVEDLINPELLVSHEMDNPHGLSVTDEHIFICEGSFGFKAFEAEDIYKIPENLLDHLPNFHSYDVIALNSNLIMVIGSDGLYQFNIDSNGKLNELSRLPVDF